MYQNDKLDETENLSSRTILSEKNLAPKWRIFRKIWRFLAKNLTFLVSLLSSFELMGCMRYENDKLDEAENLGPTANFCDKNLAPKMAPKMAHFY